MKHIIPALTIILLSSGIAHAEEAETHPAERCFPAKSFAKLKTKLAKIPAKHLDYLSTNVSASFKDGDGYGMPERFYYRYEGVETTIEVTPEGKVRDILSPPNLSEKGEFCVYDPARALPKDTDIKFGFSMGVEAAFPKQEDYTLAQLKKGLKDGRPVYKKMFGAMGFMVPKLTHVSISYDPKNVSPKIEAVKDGEGIEGLVLEPFGKIWVVEIAQLESLGADGLRISDEFKVMEPGVSIEKMKKFGFVAEEDETEEGGAE